jgi:peptide deformylase
MVLPITIESNKILHEVTKELTLADLQTEKFKTLVTDMAETMYLKDGVGIAANQVGVPWQVCVISKQFAEDKNQDLILVNPRWEKMSIRKNWGTEGCLSVPLTYGDVKRYSKIKVQALDINGKPITFAADNFFARIIQHEVDHLNGILFIEKAKNIHRVEPEM